jgi:hypothetical protein
MQTFRRHKKRILKENTESRRHTKLVTWTMPVWSRIALTKVTDPWLRCEATQPQIDSLSPTCISASVPHTCERLVNSRTSETRPPGPPDCEICVSETEAAAGGGNVEPTTNKGKRARVRALQQRTKRVQELPVVMWLQREERSRQTTEREPAQGMNMRSSQTSSHDQAHRAINSVPTNTATPVYEGASNRASNRAIDRACTRMEDHKKSIRRIRVEGLRKIIRGIRV